MDDQNQNQNDRNQKIDINALVFDTMTTVQVTLRLMRNEILRLQAEIAKLKEPPAGPVPDK